MADTYTENFNWRKPEVGAARNTWGNTINDGFDAIDAKDKSQDDLIAARVKIAGDAMTGSLTFDSDSNGIVYSADTRTFDAINSTTLDKLGHFMDVSGDALRIRTEDGTVTLLKVDGTSLLYKGARVMVVGDTYSAGTVDGDLIVNGYVQAQAFRLDTNFQVKLEGDGCVVRYDTTSYQRFDRSAASTTWVTNGATRMTLDGTGNLTLPGDISANSDARLKTDVETIGGALDAIKQIRGVSFRRIADGSRSLGVIAQDVEIAFPTLVHTDNDGIRSVNYTGLIAPLIEAIKVLTARVEFLEASKVK